ncbi:MAG: secretion protein [Isosphaeraceae bacterium]|nr:secretion protein [Isosphaeraceae bacterium]
MARRPARRRTFCLERLESREVMSSRGPSAQAQYMLERINEFRTDPKAAAEWATTNLDAQTMDNVNFYGVDLKATYDDIASTPASQPLAYNDSLAAAAQWQSDDQAQHGVQSHLGSDGSTPNQRMSRAGYSNMISGAENGFAFAQSIDNALEAFLLDWGVADKGHRRNLLQKGVAPQDSFRDVGFGITPTSNNGLGPLVITQNFGSQANEQPYLLGVVYQDNVVPDHFYTPGEGLGGVTITVKNLDTGEVQTTQTWDAGGWQIQVAPNHTYQISAQKGDQVIGTPQTVSVGNLNVKVDFVAGDATNSNSGSSGAALANLGNSSGSGQQATFSSMSDRLSNATSLASRPQITIGAEMIVNNQGPANPSSTANPTTPPVTPSASAPVVNNQSPASPSNTTAAPAPPAAAPAPPAAAPAPPTAAPAPPASTASAGGSSSSNGSAPNIVVEPFGDADIVFEEYDPTPSTLSRS